jgi:hypothetical protein
MTWADVFKRLWFVLRVRFTKQHICEECGDVKSFIFHEDKVPLRGYWWDCISCNEEKAAKLKDDADKRKFLSEFSTHPEQFKYISSNPNVAQVIMVNNIPIQNCRFEGDFMRAKIIKKERERILNKKAENFRKYKNRFR